MKDVPEAEREVQLSQEMKVRLLEVATDEVVPADIIYLYYDIAKSYVIQRFNSYIPLIEKRYEELCMEQRRHGKTKVSKGEM